MAVIDQCLTDRFAIYNGDCCEVTLDLPDQSVGLSIYSPPFCGLYNYSSSDRDMSNSGSYEEFFRHYEFLVKQMARITMPGRMSVVHCMDIPNPGQRSGYFDLPGRICDLHQANGFDYYGRVAIWKEPLKVAIRTRLKHLTHKQLVKDSCHCTIAAADFVLIFRRQGENANPVTHSYGLTEYAGARDIPAHLWQYRGERDQKKNRFSHWIWRQYASSVWDDIRIDRVLPYKAAKEPDDEKHVHPLQLDVIERAVHLWSNPGDTMMTPFMGVGSEAYGALINGRRALGVELKGSYYKQAIRNLEAAEAPKQDGFEFQIEPDGVEAEVAA